MELTSVIISHVCPWEPLGLYFKKQTMSTPDLRPSKSEFLRLCPWDWLEMPQVIVTYSHAEKYSSRCCEPSHHILNLARVPHQLPCYLSFCCPYYNYCLVPFIRPWQGWRNPWSLNSNVTSSGKTSLITRIQNDSSSSSKNIPILGAARPLYISEDGTCKMQITGPMPRVSDSGLVGLRMCFFK
jgi:hypothetical protein